MKAGRVRSPQRAMAGSAVRMYSRPRSGAEFIARPGRVGHRDRGIGELGDDLA